MYDYHRHIYINQNIYCQIQKVKKKIIECLDFKDFFVSTDINVQYNYFVSFHFNFLKLL